MDMTERTTPAGEQDGEWQREYVRRRLAYSEAVVANTQWHLDPDHHATVTSEEVEATERALDEWATRPAPTPEGLRERVESLRVRYDPQSQWGEGWNEAIDNVLQLLAATRTEGSAAPNLTSVSSSPSPDPEAERLADALEQRSMAVSWYADEDISDHLRAAARLLRTRTEGESE